MAHKDDKLLQLDAPPGELPPPPRNRLWVRVSSLSGRAWLLIIALLIAFVLFVYALWPAKKAATEEEAADVVVSVRVAEASRGTIAAQVTALGTIYGREQATVSPKISAQIKSMPLLRNRRVKAGEVIATLEARDLQAQRAEASAALDEALANLRLLSGGTIPEATAQDEKAVRDARANLNNARATYERRQQLFERGGISKKDLEASQLALTTAENDLRAAEAAARLHQTASNPHNREAATSRVKQAQDRLATLDTQLSYAVIRAPFAGVITDQFQYQGEFAAAGAKLFNIADDSEVIVKAPVADTVAASLKAGDPATVLPQDSPDERIEATVSLISPATDPQSRTVEVWVNLKNADRRLHVNSAAKVVVTTNTVTDAVIVPAAAVTLKATNADEGTVMVVSDDPAAHAKVARETKVTIGIRTAEQMEITSGLRGGETVIVEGNYALPDGTKVEINKGEEEEEGGKDEDKKDEDKGDKTTPTGGAPEQAPPAPNGPTPTPRGTAPTTPNVAPAPKGGAGAKPSAQPGGKP